MKELKIQKAKRIPRKRKKAIRKASIVYDINSSPKNVGMSMEHVMCFFNDLGVLFWDSKEGGVEPKIYPKSKLLKVKNIRKL